MTFNVKKIGVYIMGPDEMMDSIDFLALDGIRLITEDEYIELQKEFEELAQAA